MQNFAPFIPELLGALSTGCKGHSAWHTAASICLLLFNFLLLLQNLLTSLDRQLSVLLETNIVTMLC